MRGLVPPDPQSNVSSEHFAIVYVPKRNRKRFPSGCVEVVASAQAAIEHCDKDNKRFPARLLGPSKSSEGQLIYYLLEWL